MLQYGRIREDWLSRSEVPAPDLERSSLNEGAGTIHNDDDVCVLLVDGAWKKKEYGGHMAGNWDWMGGTSG